MKIGEKLKRLRQNSRKTMKETGAVFGVAINTIYRWEHNICVPYKKVAKKIAEYYEVPYEWLMYNATERLTICDDCNLNEDGSIEYKILELLKKLSKEKKNKVLEYMERMCAEEQGENKA